jgi:hypothetical protein
MNRYVREYLKKNCSGQLQELFSQSNNPYKEIAESMAAFENMREFIDIKDEKHTYLCIGDGSLCLTGALFAFYTHSFVISIDPKINIEKVVNWMGHEKVKRLIAYKAKFQETERYPKLDLSGGYDIILVHAHVNLEEVMEYFPDWGYLYSNPCCNPLEQTFSLQFQKKNGISAVKAGRDIEMITPKNDVFIYRNKAKV